MTKCPQVEWACIMDSKCVLPEKLTLSIKFHLVSLLHYTLHYKKKLNFCKIQQKKLSYPPPLTASWIEDATFIVLNKESKSGQKYSVNLTAMTSKLFHCCSNHSY